MHIEQVDVETLQPYLKNSRTHSPKQIQAIAKSIKRFGFKGAILIEHDGTIVAGHGRWLAVKELGAKTIPAIRAPADWSREQAREFLIADNRLAEGAKWNQNLLASELKDMFAGQAAEDVANSTEAMGLENGEVDGLLYDPKTTGKAAKVPSLQHKQVSKPGDLWVLGDHKIYCGSALERGAFEALLGQELAQAVFIDPPYNVKIDGHVKVKGGTTARREFAMAVGEMSKIEFTEFLKRAFANLAAYSASGAIHFICMDWRHAEEVLTAGNDVYTEFKNLCVWGKPVGGMGSFYRSQHELVFVYKSGKASHINNFQLGQNAGPTTEKGRYRTNLWTHVYGDPEDKYSVERSTLDLHPTVKPINMVADAIMDVTNIGGIVVDSFSGSGSTIMAAELTKRRGRGIELDPLYVDTIVRRWERTTGKRAVHAVTGVEFPE